MSDNSFFESRKGNLSCSPEEVFDFAGDLRNFERFIPDGTVTSWMADSGSCSFKVSMLGTVRVIISSRDPYTRLVYAGDALNKNDFTVALLIGRNDDGTAGVKIELTAELNPMMKMMAVGPINQFLEILMNEMEKFRGWKEPIK